MDEIKFRGKRIDNGQWAYGDLNDYSYSPKIVVPSEGVMYDVDPATVGQYTGLADRHNVEIYKGDIVRINHPQDTTGDFTNKLGRVFWWDEEGGWYHGHESVKDGSGRPPKRMWPFTEVVGNVYDNPELLGD